MTYLTYFIKALSGEMKWKRKGRKAKKKRTELSRGMLMDGGDEEGEEWLNLSQEQNGFIETIG